MSFLSGLFLLALPLAAIPVLIHLYRGRQRDMVYWGAMQFLEKALTKGRSWERIEEILLMLLRTAVVIALIFALSRPLVSSQWWGSEGKREVVLLVDNSLSMSRTVSDTSAFDQLKDQVNTFLDTLSGDDQIHVMLAAGGGQWLTAEPITGDYAGLSKLRSMIEVAEPTLGSADLVNCIHAVVHLESEDAPNSRRIAVFTDNQGLGWQLEEKNALSEIENAITSASVPTTIQVVDCGLDEQIVNNLAVNSVELSRNIVRPDEEFTIHAEIGNVGSEQFEGADVEWLVDGEVVESGTLGNLSPGASTSVTTTLRRHVVGKYLVGCRLKAEDQVPLDQTAEIVVEVTDEIPILVVHDPDAAMSDKPAQELFSAALGFDGDKELAWHSMYRPTVIEAHDFPEANLTQYRAIVLLDMPTENEETNERLRQFVSEGGGLWISLGENTDRASFNRSLYDDGDGLSPLALGSLEDLRNAEEESSFIHPPNGDHPALAQLANTTQLDIHEARVFMHWLFETPEESDTTTKVLLETGDGTPLVVENYVGKGRVIVQSFPLSLEWSNLPQLKVYVVLVSDWLEYLAAPSSARFNLSPGSTLVATLPPTGDPDSVKLIKPAGDSVDLAGQELEESSVARYWQTHLPGSYRIVFDDAGTETSIPFYVARDPRESQLTYLNDEQLAEIASSALTFGTAAEEPESSAEQPTRQEPIWQILLIGLIAMLAFELLLSSWLTRQRGGTPVGNIA